MRADCTLAVVPLLLSLLMLATAPAFAQDDDLAELSLEELLDVEVTSVSKKAEKRSEAATAISVLTAEDIERSGVATIPDALRLVPGVSVARLDANKWSVSIRGFSGRFANKLLVLIDGRSVYTPLFSGVYWEALDVPLKDIERIEVIRGPGSTVWGANAVNGVINIVTKHTSETQGGLAVAGAGTEIQGSGLLRYGGAIRDDAYYRLFVQGTVFDEGTYLNDDTNDAWRSLSGGFRVDWELSDADTLMLEGGLLTNKLNETIVLPFLTPPYTRSLSNDLHQSTGFGLARWQRTLANDSELQVQMFYERWETNDPKTIDEHRDTIDLEFQHRFAADDRHDIVWGAGYRYVNDEIPGTFWTSFDPESRDTHLFSAFIQDEIALVADKLSLTVGTKLEHNSYTGLEIQPSLRLGWSPRENQFVWAAISRAVRTPSRAEDDVRLASMAFPGILGVLIGDRDYESEDLWAFEGGYRIQPTENLAIDAAVFYNVYDDLRTVELRRPRLELYPFPPHLLLPAYADNNMEAETYGFELSLDWKPQQWWRIRAGYSFLEVDMDLNPRTIDIVSGTIEEDSPEQQLYLRNSFDIAENVELDVILRYVDALPALAVEDYLTADVRVGWEPTDNLSLELVGQNLFDEGQLEYRSSLINTEPSEAERGVYGRISWRF